MRLWHYELFPYLPNGQFKGQLRELVAVMHDWRDKGKTNHLLINFVMDYPKHSLERYFDIYAEEYYRRYGKPVSVSIVKEFEDFGGNDHNLEFIPFGTWMDEDYLEICMMNLYEKRAYGIGKNRISYEDW